MAMLIRSYPSIHTQFYAQSSSLHPNLHQLRSFPGLLVLEQRLQAVEYPNIRFPRSKQCRGFHVWPVHTYCMTEVLNLKFLLRRRRMSLGYSPLMATWTSCQHVTQAIPMEFYRDHEQACQHHKARLNQLPVLFFPIPFVSHSLRWLHRRSPIHHNR